jgi:hypothetical protein
VRSSRSQAIADFAEMFRISLSSVRAQSRVQGSFGLIDLARGAINLTLRFGQKFGFFTIVVKQGAMDTLHLTLMDRPLP